MYQEITMAVLTGKGFQLQKVKKEFYNGYTVTQ